jgi:hypothetical protein
MAEGMSTVFKVILLVVGSYVITVAVAAFIIALAIMILMVVESYDCSVMNRALVALWVMIAMLFLASVAVVRTVTRKVIPSVVGRRVVVVMYGMMMLASYVVIAFGLMVAFNC